MSWWFSFNFSQCFIWPLTGPETVSLGCARFRPKTVGMYLTIKFTLQVMIWGWLWKRPLTLNFLMRSRCDEVFRFYTVLPMSDWGSVCHCWALLVCLKLCLISIWKIFDEKAADVYTHCVSHYIIYVKLICHIDNHFHSFSLCFTLPDLSSQALKLSPDWSAGFDLRQQKIAPDRQSDTPKSFFHPAINMERQVKSVQSQDWVLEFW